MPLRRILFWIHLSAGCLAGVVILIMCITGIALAFERQINNSIDASNRAAVKPGPSRMPIDELLHALPERTDHLSAITLYSDPNQPLALAFGREQTMFFDPYNGQLLGQSSRKSRQVFALLERWHRALGNQLRGPGPGRSLADAANFVFLILIPTGLVLWWPRKWSAQQLRSATWFRSRLSGKAALWNYHNVVGIWCAVPLFLLALTGVIMSYSWANNALYLLTGTQPPQANSSSHERVRHRAEPAASPQQPVQTLFDRAATRVVGWQSITLRWMPESPEAVFTIDRGNGGQPNKRDQLTLDASNGQVRRWEPFSSYSSGRRLRAWARFAHTGEAGGWIGQIIACVAAFGGAVLVITGLWMTVLRLRRKLRLGQAYARTPSTVSATRIEQPQA